MSRILIVEDDRKIAQLESDYLESNGYETKIIEDGKKALSELKTNHYDLILLDLMLPGCSGYDICRKIRDEIDIPILMVTARTEGVDVIRGLGLGADDYITKPFAIEELLARIRVALKKHARTEDAPTHKLEVLGVCLDEDRHEVTVQGENVELTNREFELLHTLMRNKNIVLTREKLLNEVCGYDYVGETNIIDVYVRYLRTKIDDHFGIKLIQTVRGVGYCIKES